MKKSLFIGLIVFCCAFAKACTSTSTAFQDYVSHQVQAGETVYSISKKYNIDEKQILKLNPDARKNIYEGLVLILPSEAKAKKPRAIDMDQEDITFKTHKVRRKETLYSISKRYGVPQDVIKRYNKQLYSSPLRKGDKIKIPTNYKETTTTVVEQSGGGVSPNNIPTDGNPYEKYKVQPKETKYGVAQRYGITIAELEAMNPGMGKGLQMGTTINVPRKKPSSTEVIDKTEFDFYEVPKGDTMYSLLKRLEMNADALVDLNPALADGLKEGMVLKIPKAKGGIVVNTNIDITPSEKGDFIDLRDSITYTSAKKMVVMLPFGLKRINGDSTMTKEKLLKSDRVLRLALDFHSGILMAIDQAKKEGLSVNLEVYDTEYDRKNGASVNARKIDDIIARNNFDDVDVVIGPLIKANVNRASSLLSRKGIPLIALSSGIEMRNTTFQTRPSDKILRDRMLSYLKANGQGKNIVIIADAKNSSNKSKLMALFPTAKTVTPRSSDSGYYLYPDDIPKQISATQDNWVILETNDVPLISNVTTSLNTMVADKNVTLFTTDKGSAYDSDEIQHMHLMNLKFHFPSFSKEILSETTLSFDDAYEDMFDVSPSMVAKRGYDIAYDVILRLAYADDLFQAAASGVETQYIEHKFHYSNDGSSGFYNDAVYLMKYGEDLQLEEVKMTVPLDLKD
ncbi:LysM peptidoglycan-binding domain-containing protein [Dokdonia sinensis]|uniref:LysM peptidoglycan-binding domain-containing protein n=1 Tax=Dokdonia sinensis TaxID=2479847 RepID=A0A3M0G074_9FLAO|nr:LysM peptidoglycan-binding domain-containing protein [Dokdonia sinensis]RMB57577.1 LysM peptidoglycan-binding domain-containing protein [Dokdonia sinensis]